jgi:biofilm PGA synthesis N-glycosyltransferase PgaC
MKDVLLIIAESPFYLYTMWFLALFPIVIAFFAINASRQYFIDRFRQNTETDFPHLLDLQGAREKWPCVSIVIPARNEEAVIQHTIESALELHWPEIEIIVIDDGSTDNTATQLKAFEKNPKISVIKHPTPLGKSVSLNEGLAQAKSDIVLILDGDARPAVNALDRLVPHMFHHADVAGVTGNPRVANVVSLLSKLQAIEFTSTVSTLRRGQAAWGRINTVSGIMTALRKDVVLKLGGFSPVQPTEDIELTWRMQVAGYRCIYEPAAQVAMEAPESLGQWWAQRKRWSTGLVRVLQVHGLAAFRQKGWPVIPLLLEAVFAILWCHILILATVLWVLTASYGIPDIGNSLIVGHWGTLAVGVALIQIFWGMRLDYSHDKSIYHLWPIAPLYPLLYWWLGALAVVATTIPTLLTKPTISRWSLQRRARHYAVKS